MDSPGSNRDQTARAVEIPDGIPEVGTHVAIGVTPLAEAGGKHSAFRALRSKPFRLFFIGQIASASGTFLQQTAIGWLVLRTTGSAGTLGLVLAAGGIPGLLVGPWGGTVASRFELRRLLVATQTLLGVLAGVLWLLAGTGHATLGVIIAVSVGSGIVSIIDTPARQSFVSQLVPPSDLASAVSVNGVLMNSARVVGPAVAGVLIVTAGTTPCFAVNAVSYSAVLIALLVLRPLSSARHAAVSGNVREAVQFVRRHQQLWLPLAMTSFVGLLAFNFPVVLPLLANDTFRGSGGTYGLLSTLLSVGSVAGSLGVGFIGHPRRIYLLAAVTGFGIPSVWPHTPRRSPSPAPLWSSADSPGSSSPRWLRPPCNCMRRRSTARGWSLSGSWSTSARHPPAVSCPDGSPVPRALVRCCGWAWPPAPSRP